MHRRDEQVTEEDKMKAIKCCSLESITTIKEKCLLQVRFLFEFKIKLCMAL